MSTFVLIHGAWHGAWCWYKVANNLQNQGHKVIVPDLPALGIDRTPLHSTSLEAYADRICEVLSSCDEAVTLVGHSMGGIAITQAAEKMPQKIKTLVYLTAFLLPNGRNLIEEAQSDSKAELLPNLIFSNDQSSATIKPESIRTTLYADCSSSDIALAQSLLVPQAVLPLATPVRTTAARWGSIPRVYIECTDDRAISLSTQRSMYTQVPCERILSIKSGHSPFLSMPDIVTKHLLSLL
jgi:pimeloyl-ACP methyl ester carboxylesterase